MKWVELLLEHWWKILITLLVLAAFVLGKQTDALQWAKDVIIPLVKEGR